MTTPPRAIRVAVVDDADMIRTGFSMIVDNEDDLHVAGTAVDGREAVELCRRQPIDVVLMDIRMPVMDGLAATEAILALPDPPKVLVLTTFGLDDYVQRAIAGGASGFLLKDASADELVGAIRAVARGDAVLSPAVARIVIDQARKGGGLAVGGGPPGPDPSPVAGIDELTDREREVLEQLALGRSNAEIAEALILSEATVKTHLGRVLSKLGVRDRVQAVICAFRAGLGPPD